MDFTLTLTWLIIGVLALLAGVTLFMLQTDRYQQKLFFRFWQAVGLPVQADNVAAAARRRIRTRTSAMFVGELAGLFLVALVLFVNPSLASSSFIWLFVVPAVMTTMTTLDVGVALHYSLFRRRADAPRLARATATTMRDYVSPWRLRVAPALVVTAVLLNVGGAVLSWVGVIDPATFVRSSTLPLLTAAVIVFAVGKFVERRILQQTQPAADELELAWDDAFRAETFRALLLLETIVAWLAVGAAGIAILEGIDAIAGTGWGTGAGMQLFTLGFFVVLAIFSFGAAQTHFRHRLWPNLVAPHPHSGLGSN
ncbi:hypothetical protein K2F54_12275 [Cryobacterium sp. 1639]|uniref:hypothetical protein n=1 Tax=Cryobacterium inferilacus TaxID=2866629 RepID=UPI001C72E940|nr:hypothetical protein [Cryobacterium sp. 1639]MBX0300749.1 hypothetical protein [Cryobacterium sp. 1639]